MDNDEDKKVVKKKATRKKAVKKKAVKKSTNQQDIDRVAQIAQEEIDKIKEFAEEEIARLKAEDAPKVSTASDFDRIAKIAEDKAEADREHEPFIAIVNMDVDYDHLDGGAFEFDWNDVFITRLLKAGYRGKEDHELVDQWFNNVCRNVVMETYEQEAADLHPNRTKLDGGRREYK